MTVIEKLAATLREKIVLNCKPNEKLPSERHLAEELYSTQNRIHRALALLIDEGILYTKTGSGTFFRGHSSKADSLIIGNNTYSDNSGLFLKLQTPLRVKVILDNDLTEKHFWEEIFGLFTKEYPYIRIEPIFLEQNATVSYDVMICNIHTAYLQSFKNLAVNEDKLADVGFSFDDLADNCRTILTGRGGLLKMLPLARMSSGILARRDLLARNGISPEELNHCDNLFAAAKEMELRTGIIAMNYRNYHWHGCNYGLFIVVENGKCLIDWDLLKKLMLDIQMYVTQKNYYLPSPELLFSSGKMIMLNSYIPKKNIPVEQFVVIDPRRGKIGFLPETLLGAVISENTKHYFESLLFGSFLSSYPVQKLLSEMFPGWIPLRKDLLSELKRESEMILDERPYYSLFSTWVYHHFGPLINIEFTKYFLHLQSEDNVWEHLHAATENHFSRSVNRFYLSANNRS